MFTFTVSITYCTGGFFQGNKTTKTNKMHVDWKGKFKNFNRLYDCLLGKSYKLSKILLELIGELSTFTRYKINIQKLIVFTYTSNE